MNTNPFMFMVFIRKGNAGRTFCIVDGRVVLIDFHSVKGRKPLEPAQLNEFKVLVGRFADDIEDKWVDYFVLHKSIKPERIGRRLK